VIERAYRTLRKPFDSEELTNLAGSREGAGLDRTLVQRGAIAQRCRLCAAGGVLPRQPRGQKASRRQNLVRDGQRRREWNLIWRKEVTIPR
jgi:hypothetical protein